MVNRHISTKQLIIETIDKFNIKSSDFISRAYEWTYTGLTEMNIYSTLEPCSKSFSIVDYRFNLPCDIQILRGITYNGQRLEPSGTIKLYDVATLNQYPVCKHSYERLPNGYYQTTIKEGEVIIHYLKLPTEYDNEVESDVPLVPDNVYILNAMKWYYLMRLIERGYKHPIFDYSKCQEEWEHGKLVAGNKAIRLDPDMRERLNVAWKSMIINPTAWNNALYRNV